MPLSSVVGAQSIVRPGVCTSSTKPASPYDGQMIYMTDVDQSAVWDGSAWVGLDPSRDRNVVINGAMQIAQRGTSVASITTTGYYTADRFNLGISSQGTWTQSVEADAPTGSGFRNSLKMLCTTADSSPAAGDFVFISQKVEGFNVQQFAKGTASAKQFAISFWVKSNVTGTYTLTLQDADNSRLVSANYTISASATWERKTVTFPADTTGAFSNDNGISAEIYWGLGSGTDRTSGTLRTTWASQVTADFFVGQTNLASATNNYWQVTGVQLEAGAVATPFEFEDYGTTLAKCQRYYWRTGYGRIGHGIASSTTVVKYAISVPVTMRANPTTIDYSNIIAFDSVNYYSGGTWAIDATTTNDFINVVYTHGSGVFTQYRPYFIANLDASTYIGFSAEL